MPIILAVVVLIIIAAFGDYEAALLLAPLAGLLVLYLQTRKTLGDQQAEIEQLKKYVGELYTTLPKDEFAEIEEQRQASEAVEITQPEPAIPEEPEPVKPEPQEPIAEQTNPWGQSEQTPNPVNQLIENIRKGILSYFTDGNVFVRVGLLILFFGVAFLLKYAAENSRIPIEFRFMGAAVGGLALLIVGWRLRLKKTIYGLLLQGGGIGIIYITIFAAYQLASLLPSALTFTLLVFFAMFTVALAVLQDSRTLAIFAIVGGFLAPILASSGSGNYVGLFSYYALLNAVIFAVAWYKTWRLLNLIGFVFTFLVYILWFVFSYQSHMLFPAMGFLLLFFFMYSLIGVFYALKQPDNLKGLVDGTLVFGTPVIASSLLMAMLRHYDYGIAIGSAGLGLYYVLLARLLWQKGGDMLRLIAEAMLAIGVVFATIAIPYSLDGHWTTATWALEAAGILWVSIRQQRLYAQWFAMLLQVGAGVLFLFRNAFDLGTTVWINPAFLGGVFVALGAFISARMLYLLPHDSSSDSKLRLLHIPFFIWAMGWWLFSALIQIDRYIDESIIAGLILFTATAALLVYLDHLRQWLWMPASISAALLLPVLILLSLVSILDNEHVFVFPDVIFWVLALFACYQMIVKLETVAWPNMVNLLSHTLTIFFLACLLSFELTWFVEDTLAGTGQGFVALLTVFPLLFVYATRLGKVPAISRFGEALQKPIVVSLSILLLAWSLLVNFFSNGDPAPLPYIPLFNPLDIAHVALFVSLIRSIKLFGIKLNSHFYPVFVILAGTAFIWITAVLIRSLHHYLDIPFDLSFMLQNTRVQTAISILWTVIGMATMLITSRRSIRTAWIAGAVLIAIVLIKMLFVDLGASGTVERIVSFLVVGGLLVAMGYFSPIPKKSEGGDAREESHHA